MERTEGKGCSRFLKRLIPCIEDKVPFALHSFWTNEPMNLTQIHINMYEENERAIRGYDKLIKIYISWLDSVTEGLICIST